MKRGVLITLPQYDIVTEYLTAFTEEIEGLLRRKGVFYKPLRRENANKLEFTRTLGKLDCKMVIFNGHGNSTAIAGNKDEVIVKLGDNESILQDRIVYARSCEAGTNLGKNYFSKSEGCFIGYNALFEFYYNESWVSNPLKDNTARLFLESSNRVPLSLIKGNSCSEAHERARKQMLKNIKKVLRSKSQESFLIAESLWNNYLGQSIYGDKSLKF